MNSAQPATVQRINKRVVWDVFARRKFEEPLIHIGWVTEDDPELAGVYAQSIYNEHTWVELAVVPRSAFRIVVEA